MLHFSLYQGCDRAVSFVMEDAYSNGAWRWLERVGKEVRDDDEWRRTVLSILWGSIKIWRHKHLGQPLFKHELFDAFDADLIISHIKGASDEETLLRGIRVVAASHTQPWLLKKCRIAHPRRSERLAAKRAAGK